MKIVCMSDLHLEFPQSTIPEIPDCDLLLLAGDITASNMDASTKTKVHDFFALCASHARLTLMVMGNHEHYFGEFTKTADLIRSLIAETGHENIKLLDNERYNVNPDIAVFGATFWTDINKRNPVVMLQCARGMNDYAAIYKDGVKLIPEDTCKENDKSISLFKKFSDDIEQEGYAGILLMHHLPTWQSVDAQFRNDHLSYAYVNTKIDSTLMEAKNLVAVFHGHTHSFHAYDFYGKVVLCNPRGYPKENPNWKPYEIEFDVEDYEETEEDEESTN